MKGIARVKRALFNSSGDQFHHLVVEFLRVIYGPFTNTRRLGELDRLGIDAFALTNDRGRFQTIVQCKGFEKPEFGSSQLKQCLNEITKFQKKGAETVEYWLVLNRSIKDRAMRNQVLQELKSLETQGKAKQAILYDFHPLVKLLQGFASDRLSVWSGEKRQTLFDYYNDRLKFVDYIFPIPFDLDGEQLDPVRYLSHQFSDFFKKLPEHQAGKNRNAPQFLLTSSFGFGKTSTLQALAREWIGDINHVIYVPAALLSDETFVNAMGLARSLINLLLPDHIETSELVLDLLRDTLRSDLSKSVNWILLIDGVDENPNSINPNCISGLWGSIRDFGLPAVISVRSELVEARLAEFSETAPITAIPQFEKMKLLEWPDELILEFVCEYARRKEASAPQSYLDFQTLVETGQYGEVYGDIPKRPLFLGMLVEDAWEGKEPEKELHRLYGSYFRKKFLLDRYSFAAGGVSTRASNIIDQLGADEACERLMLIMQMAAREMSFVDSVDNEHHWIAQRDNISERKLAEIGASQMLPVLRFEDILMHSLLQPGGRDHTTRERLLRFAHRSFQDWFLARDLTVNGLNDHAEIPDAVLRFLKPMLEDKENGVVLP